MTNPGELENSSELSEQIGQLTQEIRLLRGDLFHYFEVLTRINTGEVTTTTIGSTTISSATSTSSTSLNHENSNVVLLDHDHHNENNVHVVEDDKKDDSDEEDDEEDDSYDPNSGPIMVPRIITSCDNQYVTISSNDILNYICETGRLRKPITFTKISKKRSRGRAGLPKEASKKAKLKRLDYIHSIHNCVTKHFRLPLIRETFSTPSLALKDSEIFTAVQFIVGTYMDILSSFKYTALDASVIKADLKENIRDTLRIKRDRSSRGPSTPRTARRSSKADGSSDDDSLDEDESSSDEAPTKKRKKSTEQLSTEPSTITSIIEGQV